MHKYLCFFCAITPNLPLYLVFLCWELFPNKMKFCHFLQIATLMKFTVIKNYVNKNTINPSNYVNSQAGKTCGSASRAAVFARSDFAPKREKTRLFPPPGRGSSGERKPLFPTLPASAAAPVSVLPADASASYVTLAPLCFPGRVGSGRTVLGKIFHLIVWIDDEFCTVFLDFTI